MQSLLPEIAEDRFQVVKRGREGSLLRAIRDGELNAATVQRARLFSRDFSEEGERAIQALKREVSMLLFGREIPLKLGFTSGFIRYIFDEGGRGDVFFSRMNEGVVYALQMPPDFDYDVRLNIGPSPLGLLEAAELKGMI